MSYELLLARRRILMASKRVWPTLLYLSEAEVSMCCKDGTDGKGGVFQLHPFFDDWLDHKSQCTWTTSDASRATVNGSGLVSFSSATSYGDVTISCAYRGVTKTCLLTVYETMPITRSACVLLKGGKGPGLDSTSAYVIFKSANVPTANALTCFRLGLTFLVPSAAISASQFSFLKSTSKQHQFPIEYQYYSGTKRPSASYWSGTIRSDSFYGGELTPGSTQNLDFIKASDGVFINDSSVTLHSTQSGTYYQSDSFGVAFRNNTKKADFLTHCQSSTKSLISSYPKDRDFSILFQNYIKYTDRDTWVNYTVIPNIGTLGRAFDFTSNNVPSAWFGV